jgi:type IV pilus assembly protein PilC
MEIAGRGKNMLLSSKVSLTGLLAWSRALRHGLDVGLSPVRIFRMQAKSGPAELRPLASKLADRLESGASLEEAFQPERFRYPALFLELVAVGERTGRLTETFLELEHYFENRLSARKQLASALVWPGIMYVSAIVIITILLFVMGMIAPVGSKPLDPLGLGLTGTVGALKFLMAAILFTGIMVTAFLLIRENEAIRGKIEAAVLPVPSLGECFRAFALQRFSMALHMTLEAGLRADKALRLCFRATANERYQKQADRVTKEARGGEEVATILAGCGTTLFPEEFLDAVSVGETTGQLAEVMQKQARHYRDEAARKMKLLTMIAGGVVYLMVGILVIVMIFQVVNNAVMAPYNDAMQAVDDPNAWLRGGK